MFGCVSAFGASPLLELLLSCVGVFGLGIFPCNDERYETLYEAFFLLLRLGILFLIFSLAFL